MAVRLIFFCLNLNKPNKPRSPVQNSKEYLISSEASWANFNLNKRILIWQPFLHWVSFFTFFHSKVNPISPLKKNNQTVPLSKTLGVKVLSITSS